MDFPGRLIEPGEADAAIVTAIQVALQRQGYACNPNGTFDAALGSLIKLFQSQHVDLTGRPLKADGIVGPLTWGVLFGGISLTNGILGKALAIAQTQVGVMEKPVGSNSGPQVDKYLASVNCPPGVPWCMAFVHWCFEEASTPGHCPVPANGTVLDVLRLTRQNNPGRFISKADAISRPERLKPGMVFILDHGNGHGHTGIVKSHLTGALDTIEGNTNNTASSEGVGVFELNRRSLSEDELVGLIDFSL